MVGYLWLFQDLLVKAIGIYRIVIFIHILMSWVPNLRGTSFGQLIDKLAEPYLGFFRRFIPPFGMIDFSPIIALIALSFIQAGISNVIYMIIQMLV